MTKIHSHEELIVWQKAMDLVLEVYKMTESFPSGERYELVRQIRRSAVSIPSNIAEGRRRGSRKDFRKFLLISFGSGAELETQIEIAKRLGFLQKNQSESTDCILDEVMRILNKMTSSLK